MRTMNKVFLIGNLTKDPEIQELDSGIKLGKFTLATNRNAYTQDGEKKEQTDFHNVVVWRKLAEICHLNLRKGAAVLVEGTIKTNNYTDKSGFHKKSFEVHADEINFITYNKKKDMDEINVVSIDEEEG